MDYRRISSGQIKASPHQAFPSAKRNQYLWYLSTHQSSCWPLVSFPVLASKPFHLLPSHTPFSSYSVSV